MDNYLARLIKKTNLTAEFDNSKYCSWFEMQTPSDSFENIIWMHLPSISLIYMICRLTLCVQRDSQHRCPGSGSSSTTWWRRQVCSQSCPRCLGRICRYLERKQASLRGFWHVKLKNNDVTDVFWQRVSEQTCWLDVHKMLSGTFCDAIILLCRM